MDGRNLCTHRDAEMHETILQLSRSQHALALKYMKLFFVRQASKRVALSLSSPGMEHGIAYQRA